MIGCNCWGPLGPLTVGASLCTGTGHNHSGGHDSFRLCLSWRLPICAAVISRAGSPPKSVIHMILARKGNGMHFIFQTPYVRRGTRSIERLCEPAELCAPGAPAAPSHYAPRPPTPRSDRTADVVLGECAVMQCWRRAGPVPRRAEQRSEPNYGRI